MRLALATLTRDEEALLPGLLASVEGLVDQLLIVDSGSVDRTCAIAAAAGATLISITWTEDWSAARNAALPHVKADWLLVLDADERLAPGAAAALRAALIADDFDCGLLPLHDASRLDAAPAEILSGAARRGEPHLLPRLFRMGPSLRWEAPIHELPRAWLRGKRVRPIDAPILHLGRVPSVEAARDKHARNLRLLRRHLASQPDDLFSYDYLVAELRQAGALDEANAVAARAWAMTEAAYAQGDRRARVLGIAGHRVNEALSAGDLDEAARRSTAARALMGAHPNLELLDGTIALSAAVGGAPTAPAAEAHFRAALRFAGQVFGEAAYPGATTWAAAQGLGYALLLQGRPREAVDAFVAARATAPDPAEALLGEVDALLQDRRPAEALRELVPALREGRLGDLRDGLVLAARIRDDAGAQPLLAQALAPGGRFVWPPRQAEAIQRRQNPSPPPPRR